MIITPFGDLILQKNDENIDYKANPQPLRVIEGSNYDVDARYLISFDKSIIEQEDIIKCFVDCQNVETDIDGGECLALLNFRKQNILMGLGAYEILYHSEEKTVAFDVYYIGNGLEAHIIDKEHIERLEFAVSWMDATEGRDETAVWYASDPALCIKEDIVV